MRPRRHSTATSRSKPAPWVHVSHHYTPPPATFERHSYVVHRPSTEPVAFRPFSTTYPLAAGTRWLVCSDGLSDFVPFPHLQEALAVPTARAAALQLLDAAGDGGSTDNVSLIVVDT